MEDLKTVEKLINEKCGECGYTLSSFKFNAKKSVLEIIVDRDDPINLDDITEISRVISDLLDVHDFTEKSYTLDVSSLGAEKEISIDALEKYVGKYINVHLSNPYKGLNTIEGDLVSVNSDEVEMTYKEKTRNIKVNLDKKNIDKARLAIKF